MITSITMQEMLKNGVHFGHQRRFWNPKMAPYIYGERQKVHIINLETTLPLYHKAIEFLKNVVAKRGVVLFVGTKRAAREAIAEYAGKLRMPYVNYRWLGGMLTNYKTIRQSVKRLKQLEVMATDGTFENLTKKEVLLLTKEKLKLEKSLGGIKDMKKLPDVLFVIDVNYEKIAVREAVALGIPIVAVVDTNGDPDNINYVIPGNDDALRAIRLYLTGIVEGCLEAETSAPLGPGVEEFVEVEEEGEATLAIPSSGSLLDSSEEAMK